MLHTLDLEHIMHALLAIYEMITSRDVGSIPDLILKDTPMPFWTDLNVP